MSESEAALVKELDAAKAEIKRVRELLRGVIQEANASHRFQHVKEPHRSATTYDNCRICEALAYIAQQQKEK